MITKVDKGNSVVILPIQQYETKIQNFLNKKKTFELLQQTQEEIFKIKSEKQ
jgi:hypothetical protein